MDLTVKLVDRKAMPAHGPREGPPVRLTGAETPGFMAYYHRRHGPTVSLVDSAPAPCSGAACVGEGEGSKTSTP